MCRGDGCQRDSVLLDFSTDGGFTWTLLYELDLQRYSQPRRDLISLPQSACSPATRLRWWQSLGFTSGLATTSYKRAYWALDDVLVGGWEINPSMIQESFQHSTDKVSVSDNSWTFYPHGELSRGTCGNPTGHMAWTNVQPSAGMNAITTRELIITSGFMVQFRIVVGCKDPVCSKLYPVTLEYSKDQRHDEWQPVRAACLPAQWNATHCTPFMFHEASEFSAAHVVQWTRITLMLPEQAISSGARLRWMQSAQAPSSQAWAIDDVYIGEACPGLCSGHGMCIPGAVCVCDKGYGGDDCFFIEGSLPNSLKDGFENERLSKQNWGLISGGHPGHGCGQLGPYGHGKALYFSGCHMRVAITLTMDLTLTSKLIFVLQIGSAQQNPSCFTDLESPQVEDRGVLLQFSVDGGLTWLLLASHSPRNHLRPRRLTYDLPIHMRVRGVIVRWWQPHHGGSDKDQWAIDNVEFVQVRRKTTRTHSSGRQLQNYYQHHHRTS
uniref:Reelin n=1 Tax=Eptatretus burgeri TaxID=7764 RepID=A0A8C4RB99_EPTBU